MFHDGDNPLRQIGTGYSGGVITNTVWLNQYFAKQLSPIHFSPLLITSKNRLVRFSEE